jgi:hypothetical protein
MKMERRIGWRPEVALPIAILSTCLLGGFFEAFLLGIFTLPLTALLYTLFVSEAMIREASVVSPRPGHSQRRKILKGRPLVTEALNW